MTQIVVLYDPTEGGALIVDNLIYHCAGDYTVVGTTPKLFVDGGVVWAFAGNMNAVKERELKRHCRHLDFPATHDEAVAHLDEVARQYDVEGVAVTDSGLVLAAGDFGVAEIGPELDRRSVWTFGEFSPLVAHMAQAAMRAQEATGRVEDWIEEVTSRLRTGFGTLIDSSYSLSVYRFSAFVPRLKTGSNTR